MEIYGAEAGNLALKGLAVGGLFVGGGIAPRLRALLPGSRFAKAFADKGRLSPLMESIPIKVILDSQTALWGAAALALATAAEDNG
jgi:glucokinase